MNVYIVSDVFPSKIYISLMAGKKKKDQHDANQVGVGMTPAYGGAYGTAPSVSMFFGLIGLPLLVL